MKQEEAKQIIIKEFEEWNKIEKSDGVMTPLTFFNHLQNNRPDLLNFRYEESQKYQIVKIWIGWGGK